MFNTAYSYDKTKGSQTFSREVPDYGYFINDLGKREFGVIGKTDVYSLIQRDKDNTDYSILKKYLFDTYQGGAIPGIYGDRSVETHDLIEAQDFMKAMQSKYDSLPDVVKSKYKTLMEFVYGFNKEDFELFKTDNPVSTNPDNDNKGA